MEFMPFQSEAQKIVNLLATSLGGSGGGHDKACGAVVPKPKIKQFITELNKQIK